ncbi:DL-methionine transporter ATP-binding subunit [compost metagenome]
MKITFLGEKTYESTLSRVAGQAGVNFAILQGTISTIKDVPYGQLIVRFEGDAESTDRAIAELTAQGLDVEVLA